MKKPLIVLCTLSLLLSCPQAVNAQNIINSTIDNTDSSLSSTIDNSEVAVSNTESTITPWFENAPKVNSEAAIVMEASTGVILYSKNIHETFYPASITKILTSLIALENSSLGETVTFSKKAIFDVDLDSSRIGIDEGEQLTVEQCLYGIMLESANEVSYALAEHVSGTVESFSQLMNKKAKELGCTDSNFVNPHGLPDDNHYTSAYDMALISKAAINNDTFRKITGTRTYVIPPTNIQEETRYLANHHKFIKNPNSFEGSIGGKTGYTSKAKYTLVTFAERNGVTLISVILRCDSIPNEYSDSSTILDYGFNNYTIYNIAKMENPNSHTSSPLFSKYNSLFSMEDSRLQISPNSNIILPNAANYSDAEKEITLTPITSIVEGQNVIGSITYTYDGTFIGSTDIIYNNVITPSLIESAVVAPVATIQEQFPISKSHEKESPSTRNIKPMVIGILVGLFLIAFSLYIVFIEIPYRKRKNTYHKKKDHKKRSSSKFDIDF